MEHKSLRIFGSFRVETSENRETLTSFRRFMLQKLYALVSGSCAADNPDSPMHQEVLLGGHVFLNSFKEKVKDYLVGIKQIIAIDIRKGTAKFDDGACVLLLLAHIRDTKSNSPPYYRQVPQENV